MAEGRFADKVVLITGAASGFGARAAERFAEDGAHLVLSGLSGVALLDLADRLRGTGTQVIAERVDVTEEAQVAEHITRALSQFHRLDVAINNAGFGGTLASLPETSVELYDKLMAVNARGVFLGLKHQIPPMKAAGGGAILNIASAAGLTGAGHLAAYAASKHAVVGLTRSAADEVARHGIRVNALCPSFAATPLFGDIADTLADQRGETRAQTDARFTNRIPMRRLATLDEVVDAMLWLCDPKNSFMTGQAVAVDGGLTAV